MAIRRKERLPFKTTRMGVVFVIAALVVSLGLFWRATGIALTAKGDIFTTGLFGCFSAGAACLGGAIGAIIGQWFQDEKGGTAQMGAFIGTLAGPVVAIALVLSVIFAIAYLMSFG